jgi:hypothetical protein
MRKKLRVQHVLMNVRAKIVKQPKYAMIVASVATLLLFGFIECVRAWHFQNNMREYKLSSEVQSFVDTIDRLQRVTENNPSAYFCDLSTRNLLNQFNKAYEEQGLGENAPEQIMSLLREDMSTVAKAPSFWSIVDFLPRPAAASKMSTDITSAIKNMQDALKHDIRSEYCLNLQDALSRLYFSESIRTPQGVGALLPGQIENFQVNVRQAQEALLNMTIPDDFYESHVALTKNVQNLGQALQGDDNNYVDFSRKVDVEMVDLESQLEQLRQQTLDLQLIPAKLKIESANLK